MRALRRLGTPLTLLLALVVLGEVTDLRPCADTDCGVWSVLRDAPAPAGGALPDAPSACLCHVAYVPPAAAPRASAHRGPAGALLAAPAPAPPGAVGRVPYPPPRG